MTTRNLAQGERAGKRLFMLVALLMGFAALVVLAVASGLLVAYRVYRAPAPAATAAVAAPRGIVQLLPAGGTAGTAVSVLGHGWRQGDTVFIRLESADGQTRSELAYGSAIVTAAGRFDIHFTFPADPRWLAQEQVQVVAWVPATGARAATPFGLIPPLAVATASPTATATPTAAATFTAIPPTATFTPVAPTATATAVPPTATFTAVAPPATFTALPPTATATLAPQPTATRIITLPRDRRYRRDVSDGDCDGNKGKGKGRGRCNRNNDDD